MHVEIIQGLYEVWGEGEDWRGLEESIKRRSKRLFEQWRSAEISWKINVDCCFHSIPHRDQMELINKLSFLDFQVRLKASPKFQSLGRSSDLQGLSYQARTLLKLFPSSIQ